APVLLASWASTHWLLRESGVWKDRNTEPVRRAQQHADYAYRLAVDPPAAKEVRLFGLGAWVLARFRTRRQELHTLQYEATRLRERSVLAALAVVAAGNALVFWTLADDALDGSLSVARAVVFLQAALGASAVAFGGLNWALDGAAAPVGAVARIEAALRNMPSSTGTAEPPTAAPTIRFRDVSFTYPSGTAPVLDGFDLTIPAGTSMAIVGVNGAGKTTAAKLLCRLYDPQAGAIEIDGTDLRAFDLDRWRERVTAVFQDYLRLEWTLADNVDPAGRATPAMVQQALHDAGAEALADPHTVLAKGYPGGTDLSGGQWQRVALARTLGAVAGGARVVLLDEPTAQLDVRGEAEIFERVLAATRHCTTILVSHRFQTVRRADRICVLEGGRVVELGSHDELLALGGRYRTMFELQASRFVEVDPDTGEELVHDTL
ncbi:MAG: ABC transporter ATP-binding protein, partial [Acidimicrobiia bacterium]